MLGPLKRDGRGWDSNGQLVLESLQPAVVANGGRAELWDQKRSWKPWLVRADRGLLVAMPPYEGGGCCHRKVHHDG